MASRTTRYQGPDHYDRARSKAAIAAYVQDEIEDSDYLYMNSDEMEFASLMGRDLAVDSCVAAAVVTDVGPDGPTGVALQLPAKPAVRQKLSFLERMLVGIRSLFA